GKCAGGQALVPTTDSLGRSLTAIAVGSCHRCCLSCATSVLPDPRNDKMLQYLQKPIEQVSRDAQQENPNDDHVGAQISAGIDDHPAESGGRCDHLRRNERGPADAYCYANAGEQLRQRAREHDISKQLESANTQRLSGTDAALFHGLYGGSGSDDDGQHGCKIDEKE